VKRRMICFTGTIFALDLYAVERDEVVSLLTITTSKGSGWKFGVAAAEDRQCAGAAG